MAPDPAATPLAMAIYGVRTAPGYWFAAGVMWLLAGVGGSALWLVAAGGDVGRLFPGFSAVFVIAAVVPVIYWYSSSAYRIGGGRSAIRFFADRLEVPAATAGRRIEFPRAELRASSTEMRVRYLNGFAATSVRRGHMIRFIAGTRSQALSTLTIERPGPFLADLERYLGGGAPLGPDDDRLDTGLANLDG